MPVPSENARKDVLNRDNVTFHETGPPRYEQLADFIKAAIDDGRIKAGDRLSTVRQMAEDLSVSTTTITSAFNLLRERGLIRPEVGLGTVVLDRPVAILPAPAISFPGSSRGVQSS